MFRRRQPSISFIVSVSILADVLLNRNFASTSNVFNLSPTEPWTLGRSGVNVNNIPQYTCSNFVMHEVRVYNEELSDDQVTVVRTGSLIVDTQSAPR